MRYWLWPRRLRLRRRPPRIRRLVRKRRPHRTARDRLRAFGLSRFRYLWILPVLIALIALVANVRVPRTTTVALAEPAGQVEFAGAEGIWVKSAKWRTSIPAGYRLAEEPRQHEKQLWESFWEYALDVNRAGKMGIKNAQIEAPGNMFLPGTLYTLKIEHDGGIRIDATPLSPILKGERILQ